MFSYFYKKQTCRFWMLIVLMVLSCGLEVGTAYIMSACVNIALSGNLEHELNYIVLFCAYILVYFIVDYFGRKLKYQVLMTARKNLRDDLLSRTEMLALPDFHKKNSGEWISVFTNDIDIVDSSYFGILLNMFPALLTLVISVILVFGISPFIALFILFFSLVQMLVPRVMGPKIAKEKAALSSSAASFTAAVSEHLQGFDLLKSFHLTACSFQVMSSASHHLEEIRFRTRFLSSLAMLLSFTFGQILYIGVYFFGAALAALGLISIGSMIAATQLCVYIASPLETLSGNISEVISARQVIKALSSLLEQEQSPQSSAAESRLPFQHLELKDVSFSYGETRIFEHMNLRFERGRKYLFSSQSGSGKTTLVNLLIRALESVGFSYVLNRYPQGLDTVIHQQGANLSGGERQRIGLARLELLKSPFVIFDESFSNLDETTLLDLVGRITSDPERTVLFIAHQLDEELYPFFDRRLEIKNHQIAEKNIK